jgi:hypothetical protein
MLLPKRTTTRWAGTNQNPPAFVQKDLAEQEIYSLYRLRFLLYFSPCDIGDYCIREDRAYLWEVQNQLCYQLGVFYFVCIINLYSFLSLLQTISKRTQFPDVYPFYIGRVRLSGLTHSLLALRRLWLGISP